MVRIVQPLFGSAAAGRVGTIGSFRMSPRGPQFIQRARGSGGSTAGQRRIRNCFAAAKAEHTLIKPKPWVIGTRKGIARTPLWPVFWRQFLLDHPECL